MNGPDEGPPVVAPVATPPPVASGTDESLLLRYQSGDEDAATDIYLRYAHRLRALARQYCTPNFASRFDADDVIQSVFRAFFHGARRRAYAVPPEGELWGLLMVLAINKIRTLVGYHQAEKRAVGQTSLVPDLDSHPATATDDSAAAFLRLVLAEQMAALPESNRLIIRLRTEGYEVGEIADRTGRSRRTVERVLQDFRARLSRP